MGRERDKEGEKAQIEFPLVLVVNPASGSHPAAFVIKYAHRVRPTSTEREIPADVITTRLPARPYKGKTKTPNDSKIVVCIPNYRPGVFKMFPFPLLCQWYT